VASSVEQQNSGLGLSDMRPRSRLHHQASIERQRSGQRVDRASMSIGTRQSSVGGCAALHSRASYRTGGAVNNVSAVVARKCAQPDVRADIRPAGGRGSTVR
jgi:hypothetical protein